MKILAIGNSFSQDATAYLHPLARAAGETLFVENLYIGGCSLETHWTNASENLALYQAEENGSVTGGAVSIGETLRRRQWDYVTLQQASYLSGLPESYSPFIENLAGCIREHAPGARLVLHQTWAYEPDSDHGGFANYGNDQAAMFAALKSAYHTYAGELGFPLIPTGEVIQRLRALPAFNRAAGGESICRDGFHLSLTWGRYAAAAVWLRFFTGCALTGNAFLPFAGAQTPGPAAAEEIRRVVDENVRKIS